MTPNRQGLRVSGIRQLPPERSVRDARQLRALAAPYPLRQLACQMTRRHRAQITALGVAGVCGFVAALACLRTGLWGSVAYVAAVTGSLLALLGSLAVALLGDPYELERLRMRARNNGGTPSRRGGHALSSSSERAGRGRSGPQEGGSVWTPRLLRP